MAKHANTRKLKHPADPTVSLIIGLGLIVLVGLGCGVTKTPPPQAYVGTWSGSDGTTITIRSDGGADYKSDNSSIENGGITIDEAAKTLKLNGLIGGPTYNIDKAPDGGQMTLNNVVFKRSGGGTALSSDSRLEVPSKEKLQALVRATIHDFHDAIQSGDFTDFHKKTGKPWRETTSPEELEEAFKTFVEKKERFDLKSAISSVDALFSPEPSIGKVAGIDALLVKGSYPTKPKQLHFDLKYAMDDGTYKLVSIEIQTKDN